MNPSPMLHPPPPPTLRDDPWRMLQARILERRDEVEGVFTIDLELTDPAERAAYRFYPGQFNMLYAFGAGEAPISIASPASRPGVISHAIRAVGRVTCALADEKPGAVIGLRGPFGSRWPVEAAEGRNLILAAGGLGLPPLRPVLEEVLARRGAFERVALVYGAKTPSDLMYPGEYDRWRAGGIELLITADRSGPEWRGERGLVPEVMRKLRPRGSGNVAFLCGPEIMMKYAAAECRTREIPAGQIFVSMERNMKCACAFCGHCQLGPEFVCKDGPVFSLERIGRYLAREGF